jgi:hypothetical protein
MVFCEIFAAARITHHRAEAMLNAVLVEDSLEALAAKAKPS